LQRFQGSEFHARFRDSDLPANGSEHHISLYGRVPRPRSKKASTMASQASVTESRVAKHTIMARLPI
jgi:hypothetical protein